ncbi:MAG: site-2 protease family protein [Planctomycetota bacterium]
MIEKGSLRLVRLFGVTVFVHWTWALVAVLELRFRQNAYGAQFWNVAEYLTLFVLVLLHEFGHALACRSVGGKAERIMLWPLGGVAFVSPPPRAGALLWSIAAGPLVNVVLIPLTVAGLFAVSIYYEGGATTEPTDLWHYAFAVTVMNVVLLAFNLLPIYPLDGGQILRAALWFFVGPYASLSIAASIGLVASLAGIGVALWLGDWWLVVMAIFAALQSRNGLAVARRMSELARQPRHPNARCPACHEPPPLGPLWSCACGERFDTFLSGAMCPRCQRVFEQTHCPFCGRSVPLAAWLTPEPAGADAAVVE